MQTPDRNETSDFSGTACAAPLLALARPQWISRSKSPDAVQQPQRSSGFSTSQHPQAAQPLLRELPSHDSAARNPTMGWIASTAVSKTVIAVRMMRKFTISSTDDNSRRVITPVSLEPAKSSREIAEALVQFRPISQTIFVQFTSIRDLMMDHATKERPRPSKAARVKFLGLLIAAAATGCQGPMTAEPKPLPGGLAASTTQPEANVTSSGSGSSAKAAPTADGVIDGQQTTGSATHNASADDGGRSANPVALANYEDQAPGNTAAETNAAPAPPEPELEDLLRPDSVKIPAEPAVPMKLPEPDADQRQPDQLGALVNAALASHPRIQAARRRVAAAANQIPQARALPDPMLNNTFWPITDHALQTAAGRVGHQMGVNQSVPWPEKLDARAAVAAREVEIAQAEVDEIEREIAEAVQLAYYELWFAQRAVEIVEDNQELVEDLKQVSEARYRAGGTQQDILRAELEADKLEEQLIELRRRVEQARADLGALVRQPADLMPEATVELPQGVTRVDLMQLIADAERCNPTLRGLAAEIARDTEEQRLAYLQKYPDFQLGLGWTLVTEDEAVSPVANGHDNINFTLGITLPVWKEKIAAGIREAANRRASTAQLREAEEDRLFGEIRRLVAAAEAALEQIELFEQQLIPRTEQTLSLATADYRGERTDFFNLVDIYQELLTYQLQLARARATLAGTIAEIERAAGCSLTPTSVSEPAGLPSGNTMSER